MHEIQRTSKRIDLKTVKFMQDGKLPQESHTVATNFPEVFPKFRSN